MKCFYNVERKKNAVHFYGVFVRTNFCVFKGTLARKRNRLLLHWLWVHNKIIKSKKQQKRTSYWLGGLLVRCPERAAFSALPTDTDAEKRRKNIVFDWNSTAGNIFKKNKAKITVELSEKKNDKRRRQARKNLHTQRPDHAQLLRPSRNRKNICLIFWKNPQRINKNKNNKKYEENK